LKHPMPLEDRRDMVLGLVNKLQDDVGMEVTSFKVAVSAWGPALLDAVLFYLARARPCMKVATVRNEIDGYVTERAVDVPYREMCGVLTSWEKQPAAMQLISECRFGSSTKLIAAAMKEGFNPSEVEPKAASGAGGALASGTPSQEALGAQVPTRALSRMSTDEELQSLRKRNQVLELRKALVEKEVALKDWQRSSCDRLARLSAKARAAKGPCGSSKRAAGKSTCRGLAASAASGHIDLGCFTGSGCVRPGGPRPGGPRGWHARVSSVRVASNNGQVGRDAAS